MAFRGVVVVVVLLSAACASASPLSTSVGDDAADEAAFAEPDLTDSVVLGILPFLPAADLDRLYGPLAQALSAHLGVPVHLRTASSFEKYSDNLQQQVYDVALVQPFEYVHLVEAGYVGLARVDEPLLASIVASADSPYANRPQLEIADLALLNIGTPPKSSAIRQLLEAHFTTAGIAPASAALTAFGTHTDCLEQLSLATIEACAVAPVPLRDYEEATDERLVVVAFLEPIPSIAFVARPGLESRVADVMRGFFLGLEDDPDGPGLLKSVGTSRYVPIEPGDFEPVRQLAGLTVAK